MISKEVLSLLSASCFNSINFGDAMVSGSFLEIILIPLSNSFNSKYYLFRVLMKQSSTNLISDADVPNLEIFFVSAIHLITFLIFICTFLIVLCRGLVRKYKNLFFLSLSHAGKYIHK